MIVGNKTAEEVQLLEQLQTVRVRAALLERDDPGGLARARALLEHEADQIVFAQLNVIRRARGYGI